MSDYNKIAKNTVILYLRMLLGMIVGLYTSRVFLQALGAEDYGLYSLVGGFVAFFSVITSALTGAISRFMTFELGRGCLEDVRKVFSTSMVVVIGLSIIVIIAGETIGLWLLYNKLVIPPDRLNAAFWVFQLGIASFAMGLLMVPYGACIGAHEKFGVFALFSLLDIGFKLAICYLIMYNPFDRLVFYAILLFLETTIMRSITITYCKRHFEECAFKLRVHKGLLKHMFSYSFWSFIGSGAWILRSQGAAIVLNLFGGPVVNTANAFAAAISSTVCTLQNNFTGSFRPQLTKQYAAGLYSDVASLLSVTTKFSFYLIFIFALPVMLNADYLLYLWLGDYPVHTVSFVRLILILSLLESFSVSLIIVKNATGQIRNYQLVVGGILLLSVPLAYLGLSLGAPMEWLFVSYIIISIICTVVRVYMLSGDIPCWSARKFCYSVVQTCFAAVCASILPILINEMLPYGFVKLAVTSVVSFISCIVCMYAIGMNRREKEYARAKASKLLNKLFGRWKKVEISEA